MFSRIVGHRLKSVFQKYPHSHFSKFHGLSSHARCQEIQSPFHHLKIIFLEMNSPEGATMEPRNRALYIHIYIWIYIYIYVHTYTLGPGPGPRAGCGGVDRSTQIPKASSYFWKWFLEVLEQVISSCSNTVRWWNRTFCTVPSPRSTRSSSRN